MEILKPYPTIEDFSPAYSSDLSPLGRPWDDPYSPAPDPRTGALTVDPDIIFRSKKFNLEITNYYSSVAGKTTPWGQNRNSSLNQSLASNAGTLSPATITRGDFSIYGFTGSAGVYTAGTAGCISTLSYASANNSFTEYFPDGSNQLYTPNPHANGSWLLGGVTDPAGVTNTYTFHSAGISTFELIGIQLPGGNLVSLVYNAAGLVQNVQDWSGRSWTYLYDTNKNLTTYTTPLGCSTQYSYIAAGSGVSLLSSITDPRGFLTTYSYDSLLRVVSMAQGNGIWTYSYDASNGYSNVTAPSGGVTTYNYNSTTGNLSTIQHPEGYTSTLTYDSVSGFRTGEQVPAGWKTSITSNNNALPEVVVDALGNTTTYQYDSNQNLTTVTDAMGAVTTYAYNSSRLVTRMTDPLGRVTSYAYDAFGQLTATTDPRGLITTNSYSSVGNLVSVLASDGGITTYGYDSLNRMITSTDPIGRTTSYAYDAADNLLATTDPTGAISSNIYSSGLLQATIDPLGNRTTYAYNRYGQMISVQNALGYFTTYSYDSLGNQVSIMDALTRVTTSVYNSAAQKIADRTRLETGQPTPMI